MTETTLYAPVRDFFETRGFRVRGEVASCDLAAERDGRVVAVELKVRLELRLLEQAVERQRSADLVYVAIPADAFARRRSRRLQQQRLVRRLEVGLITVSEHGHVDVHFHPEPYRPKRRRSGRATLLREIAARSSDDNTGGSRGGPKMTAYREGALKVAWTLSRLETASPKRLKEQAGVPKAPAIVQKNYYGWFVRVAPGVYALTSSGEEAIREYSALVAKFKNGSTLST